MPKFATLKQPDSLAKMAHEAIRKSILSGQWKIGELYNEKAIQPTSEFHEHRSERHY